jgi:hypothetical protein
MGMVFGAGPTPRPTWQTPPRWVMRRRHPGARSAFGREKDDCVPVWTVCLCAPLPCAPCAGGLCGVHCTEGFFWPDNAPRSLSPPPLPLTHTLCRYLGEEVTRQKETAAKLREETTNRIAASKVACMTRRTFRLPRPKLSPGAGAAGAGTSERLTEEAMEAAAADLGAALFDDDEEGTIKYEQLVRTVPPSAPPPCPKTHLPAPCALVGAVRSLATCCSAPILFAPVHGRSLRMLLRP